MISNPISYRTLEISFHFDPFGVSRKEVEMIPDRWSWKPNRTIGALTVPSSFIVNCNFRHQIYQPLGDLPFFSQLELALQHHIQQSHSALLVFSNCCWLPRPTVPQKPSSNLGRRSSGASELSFTCTTAPTNEIDSEGSIWGRLHVCTSSGAKESGPRS